jgi:hypothetical protein
MGVSGFYGHDYQTNPPGTGTPRARWQLDVPATAVHQVAVWYAVDPNRGTNAPMWVGHAGGSTTVTVNQRSRGGQWVSLRDYLFVAGTATVVLTNDADGYVIADAVRILPRHRAVL